MVFSSLNKEKTEKIISKLENDIAKTLMEIIYPIKKEGEKHEITASDAKYIQEWKKLWKEWDKAVSKIGDENGPYVYYESHWDPPCFYGEPLSEALDLIAEQILPLVEKIYKLKIEDEDKFFIALQEIEDRFHSYPEWIYADDTECTISLNTTQCILDWQWLFAKEHEKPVRAFLNKLINIEEMLENIYLSTGTIIDFVISLSDEQQKEVYDYITENETKAFFKEKLYKTSTAWHHIYISLSRKFNRKVYLEMCRNMIDREWSYGCPLVDYYLEEKNYEEAEPILEKIFNSFAGNTQWNPVEMLLIKLMIYRDKDCKNTITDLLQKGILLSEILKKDKRKTALMVQHTIVENPYSWDKVIELFRDLNKEPCRDIIKKLFRKWQIFNVEESLSNFWNFKGNNEDNWIYWLIETGLYKDRLWFIQKMTEWLYSLSKEEFKKQHELIYILTGDLSYMSSIKKEYPSLFKFFINDNYGNEECAKSRREWLGRVEAEKLLPLLMESWKKHIIVMVPDPSTAHNSNYNEHACWLAVLKEFNINTYRNILNKWEFYHKRRKNLWKAISSLSLTL